MTWRSYVKSCSVGFLTKYVFAWFRHFRYYRVGYTTITYTSNNHAELMIVTSRSTACVIPGNTRYMVCLRRYYFVRHTHTPWVWQIICKQTVIICFLYFWAYIMCRYLYRKQVFIFLFIFLLLFCLRLTPIILWRWRFGHTDRRLLSWRINPMPSQLKFPTIIFLPAMIAQTLYYYYYFKYTKAII